MSTYSFDLHALTHQQAANALARHSDVCFFNGRRMVCGQIRHFINPDSVYLVTSGGYHYEIGIVRLYEREAVPSQEEQDRMVRDPHRDYIYPTIIPPNAAPLPPIEEMRRQDDARIAALDARRTSRNIRPPITTQAPPQPSRPAVPPTPPQATQPTPQPSRPTVTRDPTTPPPSVSPSHPPPSNQASVTSNPPPVAPQPSPTVPTPVTPSPPTIPSDPITIRQGGANTVMPIPQTRPSRRSSPRRTPTPPIVSVSPTSLWVPPSPTTQYSSIIHIDHRPADVSSALIYDISNIAPFQLITDTQVLRNTREKYARFAQCMDQIRNAENIPPGQLPNTDAINNGRQCVHDQANEYVAILNNYYPTTLASHPTSVPSPVIDGGTQPAGNILGLYNPETSEIRAFLRKQDGTVVGTKSLFGAITHEWMHHYDTKYLGLPTSYHTPGFRDRAHFLYKQVINESPYNE